MDKSKLIIEFKKIKDSMDGLENMMMAHVSSLSERLSESDGSEDSSSKFLSEEDINGVTQLVYEYLDEYFQNDTLTMSSPNFYQILIEDITNITFEVLLDANLCQEYHYDDVIELVDEIYDSYREFNTVPERSYAMMNYQNPELNEDILSELTQKIQLLSEMPQPQQRTKEWYEFRHGLISASNIWKAFGSDAQKNSLIYEKCCPLIDNTTKETHYVNTESPMHWGVKYEPVTVMIYEDMFNTEVGEFGCIQHAEYPFIGASPDGINIDPTNEIYGRMVEIKNVVNRELTGIPKEDYWIQTQVQMETCDLNECDFIETKCMEYHDESSFYEDNSRDYKGVILHFIDNINEYSSPTYAYMPFSVELNKDSIEGWIQKEKSKYSLENKALMNVAYWYLEDYSCVVIKRNKQWFDKALPIVKDIWNTILKERIEGYEHRAAKKRSPSIVLTSEDGNTKNIKTDNHKSGLCLVKLDF
jgi:putative phage-type endonuclease